MADKDFGVRGLNLIGQTGTPTIISPNNLNINAATVAISTDVSIGGKVVSNVVVSNSYSVGIGTTVLTEKLNVSGNANISGVVSATSFVGSGSSLTGLVSNQLASVDDAQPHYILLTKSQSGTSSTVSSSYNYIFYNPNSKRLGIGTDSPTANLDVNGTGRFVGTVTAPTFQGTATTATTAIGLGTTSSINTSGIITATGGFSIGIQSSGNNVTTGVITAINFVGSGNTFSYNSTTKVIDISISAGSVSGGSSVSILTNTTNQNQYIPYASSFGNTTGFGATTLLVYNPSTGNLGIGTTNPTSKLQVQGDVYISGVSTIGFLTATNAYVGVATVGFITATNAYVGVATVGFITATNAYIGVATVGFLTATNLRVSGFATVGFITATNAYIGVATVGFVTATNAYIGVATVGFITATNAYIGVATVGFITATNTYITGVTTSGGVVVTTNNVYKIGIDTVLNSTTLGSGVTFSSLTSVGTLRQLSVSSTGITTVGFITATSAYVSGVITATTFSTGIATESVGFSATTISGPPTIYISPYKVGLSSGTVRIIGNLIVEGSTTTETQATIQTSAKTIGVAVSITDNIGLDGAGIGIGSTSIQKTLLWQNDSSSLKSSENFNIANGKVYQINDTSVLSSTTLGSGVTNSSLTSVGTLNQLVVSSNTSTDAVRITQVGSGNALIVEDSANPDATAFIVSSDGSVGIGTTIPAYKLTITNNALPTYNLTNAIADFTGSVDGYTQLNIRNSLAAASASSDLIATADTGSDTTNFIDLGINNSAFSSGSWTVNGALDGYLYTSDGSLSIGIGTTNTAKYLSFFAGGFLAANEQVRINQTGVGIGTTNPTSKLHVAGDVRITGVSTLGVTTTTNLTSQQLNVSGITTVGFITATNAYIGVATVGFLTATNAYVGVATVGFLTATNIRVSGVTTVGFITATNAYIGVATVGFITATNIWVSGITTTQTLNVGTGGTVIITTSSGSVGIGTTNPTFALDIFSTSNNSNGILRVRSQYATAETAIGDNFIKFNYSGGSTIDFVSSLNFRDSSFNPILYLQNSTKNVLINTSTETGTANQFLQVSGGAAFYGTGSSVGIGTTNPTSKLHVQGNAYITGVTTSTDFDSLSDFNLKTNIQQIDDSLAKVIQIRGVTFNWKETNRSSAGVIAQEVEKVLPELVNGEETKTVNYNGVIGALVEAVKELKAENDVLKERLDEVYKKVFG